MQKNPFIVAQKLLLIYNKLKKLTRYIDNFKSC